MPVITVRRLLLAVLICGAFSAPAGEWTECKITITASEEAKVLSTIARCTYSSLLGEQVVGKLTQKPQPANQTNSCSGQLTCGTHLSISPYGASTTYSATATYEARSVFHGGTISTATVFKDFTTPPPERPRTDPTPTECTDLICPPHSPLVIDLRSARYAFSDAANGTDFDIDADGDLDRIAWPVDDAIGFLYIDRNGNGVPDDGSELFGDHTRLANGLLAANGFEALRELDTNGDGVVSADDARWPSLGLWRDADRDGRASAGELSDAATAGVLALSLDYQSSGRRDQHGNTLRWKAMVRLAGRMLPYYDVYLITAQ